MQTFSILFLCLTSFQISFADLVCPQAYIGLGQGLTGTIPFNSPRKLSQIPINFNCTFSFQIPNGYAIRFSIDTDYNYQKDDIVYTANYGGPIRLGTPIQNIQQWAASSSAELFIATQTNDSRIFVEYSYVFVGNYKKSAQKIGEYLKLTLENGTFYTFTTTNANDRAAFQYVQRNSQADYTISHFFLFDGPDISNSRLIGKLSDIGMLLRFSSGNSFSIVNFYGTKSLSYLMTNDRSAIDSVHSYDAVVVGSGVNFQKSLADASSYGALLTVICDNCKNLYISSLSFNNSDTDGLFNVRPLSPTARIAPILTYNTTTFTQNSLPQLIPSRMFTLFYSKTNLNITIDSTSSANWLNIYKGRHGLIYSPSNWDPLASNSYNHVFHNLANDSTTHKIAVEFKTKTFGAQTDVLSVKIGNSLNQWNIDRSFRKNSTSFSRVSASGKYLSVGLTANSTNVVLGFSIDQSGASPEKIIITFITVITYLSTF